MEPYILIIICAALAVIIGLIFAMRKRGSRSSDERNGIVPHDSLTSKSGRTLSKTRSKQELSVKFEDLSALTEAEESRLIEIKDENLLGHIDNAVPGTFRAMQNSGAAYKYLKDSESVGQLYQAIIPKGAVLDKSKAMEGAFRATYRVKPNRIAGQANLVAADNSAANNLVAASAVNSLIGVAAMVVGQYYMTQINGQLDRINSDIEKITNFQKNEFKSKVYNLVAEIQASSSFQSETMADNELRNRELQHLKSLEHECTQLLCQSNLGIQDVTKKDGLNFNEYEDSIHQAEMWYQFQQILLEIMYKIADLNYVLNAGAISRDNSYALVKPYVKQSDDTLQQLNDWHHKNSERFGIELEEGRRKRQGLEGVLMRAFGLFDDDLNYKKMSDQTTTMIEHQENGNTGAQMSGEDDLFQEDVRLIAKDGKLYYLPEASGSDSEGE